MKLRINSSPLKNKKSKITHSEWSKISSPGNGKEDRSGIAFTDSFDIMNFGEYLVEKRRFEKMGGPTTPHKNSSTEEAISDKMHHLLSKESKEHPKHQEHNEKISSYKESSRDINHSHRNPKAYEDSLSDHNKYEKYLKTHHSRISDALDHVTSQKTKHDFHVYRGLYNHNNHNTNNLHINLEKEYPVGSIHHDKGFTGTSLRSYTAKGFAKGSRIEYNPHIKHDGGTYKSVIAKIHVKPGTKGHYLDSDGRKHKHRQEREYLLHRGTKFKVTGHSFDPEGNHYVHMDIHSQEEH